MNIYTGKTMTVECNDGYHIPISQVQAVTVECSNGIWSGPFQCSKIRCPTLNHLMTYDLNIQDYTSLSVYTTGTKANVTCMSGYYYRGHETTHL